MAEFDENRVRKQIEKRYEERQGLIIHAVIFVMVNIAMWLVWYYAQVDFPFPIIITMGWGSGMLAHFLTYYYKFGGGAAKRDEAIEREIERYRERTGYYEKPKNERRVELTEDGEIEEIYEDEVPESGRRRRR